MDEHDVEEHARGVQPGAAALPLSTLSSKDTSAESSRNATPTPYTQFHGLNTIFAASAPVSALHSSGASNASSIQNSPRGRTRPATLPLKDDVLAQVMVQEASALVRMQSAAESQAIDVGGSQSNDPQVPAPMDVRHILLLAEVYLFDAKHHLPVTHKTDMFSLRWYMIYHSLGAKCIRALFMTTQLLLVFIEYPQTYACPTWIAPTVELVCLCFLFLDLLLGAMLESHWRTFFTEERLVVVAIAVILFTECIISWCIELPRGRLGSMLRPIIIVYVSTDAAVALRSYLVMLPRVFVPTCLLLIMVYVFTLVAMSFTLRMEAGLAVFPTFGTGFFRMFVLNTTVNNPDVWMPLYNTNRLYFLLFALYATCAIFILMNVLLARIFRHYKGQLERAVESLEQQKQEAIDMCFDTLDNIDDGYQRQGKFNDQTMRMLLRRYNKDEAINELLFAMLDCDGDNYVDITEFRFICDVLFAKIKVKKPHGSTFVAKMFPKLEAFMRQPYYRWAVDMPLIFNGIMLVVQMDEEVRDFQGEPGVSLWARYVNVAFIFFYFAELLLRTAVFGIAEQLSSFLQAIDTCLIITLFGLAITSLVLYPAHHLVPWIMLLTSLRLIRPFAIPPVLRRNMEGIIRVSKHMWPLLYLWLVLAYAFGVMGMFLFAYEASSPAGRAKLAAANAGFHANNYYKLGFDDFYSTIVTLWTLTIVNNWFVFADAYAILMGTGTNAYFYMWYFFSVTYGTSVVTALFLVLFVRELDSDKWTELTYKGTTYIWQKRVTMVEMMKGALAERERREARQSQVRQKQIKKRLSHKPDSEPAWMMAALSGRKDEMEKLSDEEGVWDVDEESEVSHVGLNSRSRAALIKRRRGRLASV